MAWGAARAAALAAALGTALAPGMALAQALDQVVPAGIQDVTELDLEDLLNQGVTSVSKKEERLMGAPAAIYVVRGEDIRRTGVRTLAEALAMVPGLQVARLTSNLWAVASRGFADITANKLLVLIDGRTVYTPSFAGVWWDVQDLMLEDVDRIEVIRGPGGTLWGANAVNGVVNVVTRTAAQTTGLLATAGGGSTDRGFAAVRHGAQLAPNLHARAYAKVFDWDTPGQAGDHYWQMRAGFRADWQPRPRDTVTVQGDGYAGDGQFTLRSPTLTAPFSEVVQGAGKVSGGNLLGRYTRGLGARADLSLQAYYDFTARSGQLHGERRHTADVQIQHRFPLLDRHDVMWGLEYRIGHDDIDNSFTISFDPTSGTQQLASAFAQDEVTLVPDRLRATLGSKLEYHSYTGFEWAPNARVSFTPHARHGLWAAVSRAVRTPARNERDVRVNRGAFGGMTPVLVSILGSRNYGSEILWAYETGYRVNPIDPVTLDVTAFYDRYHRLRSLEPQPSVAENDPPPSHLLVALLAQNRLSGEVMGDRGHRALAGAGRDATGAVLQLPAHEADAGSGQHGHRIQGHRGPQPAAPDLRPLVLRPAAGAGAGRDGSLGRSAAQHRHRILRRSRCPFGLAAGSALGSGHRGPELASAVAQGIRGDVTDGGRDPGPPGGLRQRFAAILKRRGPGRPIRGPTGH